MDATDIEQNLVNEEKLEKALRPKAAERLNAELSKPTASRRMELPKRGLDKSTNELAPTQEADIMERNRAQLTVEARKMKEAMLGRVAEHRGERPQGEKILEYETNDNDLAATIERVRAAQAARRKERELQEERRVQSLMQDTMRGKGAEPEIAMPDEDEEERRRTKKKVSFEDEGQRKAG